jgi:hypothetical protein
MSFTRDMKDFFKYDVGPKIAILTLIIFVFALLLANLIGKNRNECELIEVGGVSCVRCQNGHAIALSCKW